MVRQNDGELAWDPLWAFVLGEEDEKRRWIKKRNDPKKSDEGFLSYIQDVFPVAESRDEKKVFGSRNEERGKGDTRTKRLWRRGSKAESESAESWQWQFDPSIAGTNSYDTLSSLYSSPNDRRNKSQSSRCKKEQAATSKFWRFSQDPEPGGSWDWNLGSSASSSKKGVRRVRFARSAKSESEEPNLLKGTKVVVEQLQKSQSFIFDLVGINPSTSPLDSCSEGVESSENVSKDFIPLAIPRNKSHAQTKVVSTEKKPEKKEQTSTTESSAFLFADLFNHWGDDSSSLDDLSLTSSQLESSTLDSSVASTEEASDFTEEDDTRSTFTNQSDSSSSFFAREQDKPVLSSRNFSDINLASQPIRQENNSANLLPIIKEEGSNDEPHFYPDDRSESESEPATTLLRELGTTGYTDRLQRLGSVNSILEEFESGKSKSDNGLARHECIDDDSLQQTGLLGRGMCRSVKTLSCEQQTWTAKSGIPFHELSQQELSQIFPKVRSVADEQKYVSSSLLVSPFASGRSGLAHLQANLEQSGPQSLYEYDYESGVHMFVSYDRFGVDELKVITASTPSFIRSESKTSSNEILVQVEVSAEDSVALKQIGFTGADTSYPSNLGINSFADRLLRSPR